MMEPGAGAEKALAWIERHRDDFSLRRGRDPWEQAMLLKPFSELMLTITLMGRDPRLRERFSPIVEWAWHEIDDGLTLIELSSAKAELVEAVGLYADFAQSGYRNERLNDWLKYLVGTQLTRGLELTPWRTVAYHYNLRRLDLGPGPILPTESWLGAMPEPWTLSVTTAYPMTHEVFYLTEFGSSACALDAEYRAYLELWLPAWQSCFLQPENLDLLAEFVMTAACIHLDPDENVLDLIAARQLDDGSVPGPRGAGGELPAPKGDAARRSFLSTYHTTLVSALAFTHRQWSSPTRELTYMKEL